SRFALSAGPTHSSHLARPDLPEVGRVPAPPQISSKRQTHRKVGTQSHGPTATQPWSPTVARLPKGWPSASNRRFALHGPVICRIELDRRRSLPRPDDGAARDLGAHVEFGLSQFNRGRRPTKLRPGVRRGESRAAVWRIRHVLLEEACPSASRPNTLQK